MDYLALKILHVTGISLTFMGLTGVLAMRQAGETTFKKRWIYHVSHGIGQVLLLVTGIALGVKLGVTHPAPFWVIAKFCIWLLAGGAMFFVIRFSRFAGIILVCFAALVAAAAWLATSKPS